MPCLSVVVVVFFFSCSRLSDRWGVKKQRKNVECRGRGLCESRRGNAFVLLTEILPSALSHSHFFPVCCDAFALLPLV